MSRLFVAVETDASDFYGFLWILALTRETGMYRLGNLCAPVSIEIALILGLLYISTQL